MKPVRVYGLVSWPVKTDKTGALVRKYCEFCAGPLMTGPELKDFPDKVSPSLHQTST
jgi:cryptochrome